MRFLSSRRGSAPRALVVWLLLTFALAACGAPDPTIGTPRQQAGATPGGSILFVSGGNVTMWNGGLSTLTSGFTAAFPAWSPSGNRFAYVRMGDAFSDLYIADRSGKDVAQLTRNEPSDEPFSEDYAFNAAWALDPVWSPVADQIAFVSDKGGLDPYSDLLALWFAERWDVQADPYPLPAAQSIGRMQEGPTFSPDGNQLAFTVRVPVSDTVRSTQLWVMDLNGGVTRTLDDGSAGAAYDPAWSPTGDNIAFIRRTGASDDIWIAPARDGEPYQLTQVGTLVSPAWSPDGRYLAFFKATGGGFEAWYVEVSADATGRLSASEPQKLFTADNIDAPSGMSWSGS